MSREPLVIIAPTYRRVTEFLAEYGISLKGIHVALSPDRCRGLRGGVFIDLWRTSDRGKNVWTEMRRLLRTVAEFKEVSRTEFARRAELRQDNDRE